MTDSTRSRIGFTILAAIVVGALLTCASSPSVRRPPGTISGYSFPESHTVETALEWDIYAILVIEGAKGVHRVVVTDENGYFELTGVPAGRYRISPLHISSEWDVDLDVAPGEETSVMVPTPDVSVNMLDINVNVTNSPMNDAVVRRALSAAIDREQLASSTDIVPSATLFPDAMDLTSIRAHLDTAPDNDLAAANRALSNLTTFSIELLCNDNEETVAHITGLRPHLEALARVKSVRVIVLPWGEFLNRRGSGDYEVSRFGWLLDSNNLARYLELWRTGGWTGYANSAFDAVLDQAHVAIAAGNIVEYEARIVQAHNILIRDLPSIPVYTR